MSEHPSPEKIARFLKEMLARADSEDVALHLEGCCSCQKIAQKLIERISSCGDDSKHKNESAHGTHAVNAGGREDADVGLDDSPPRIPQSRFLIIEELARGGMGVVYRGFDRAIKRQVAIKVPRQNHRDSNTYRLCREADIAGQLQHPGVVPIYERGQLVDGRPYLVMKLIEGKTLLELIRDPNSQQPELLRVFGEIVKAMAYAHSQNYVHRDLKPQNVMIGKFGEVHIIDWGLAKRLTPEEDFSLAEFGVLPQSNEQVRLPLSDGSSVNDLYDSSETRTAVEGLVPGETQVGAVMGSHGYMSPEQIQGQAVSKRSDVFAMGGILFQILTGDAPCATQTLQKESTHSFGKSVEFNYNRPLVEVDGLNCSAKVVELCKACLSEDPVLRPEDAQAIQAIMNAATAEIFCSER